MPDPVALAAGSYRYLPGGFQDSAGVQCDAGHAIERAMLERLNPLAGGFALLMQSLASAGAS